jgi:hypothetical protein
MWAKAGDTGIGVQQGGGGIFPPLDRLHGYNVGKYEVKLRSERLHYRLQSGYSSGYTLRAKFKRIGPTEKESGLDWRLYSTENSEEPR